MAESQTSNTILGKYRILREIARSNNVVYEGVDLAMGRRIAVKELILSAALTGDRQKEYVQRFYREAKAAGTLTHPNIVTIHDVGEDNGRHYIVMEYLDGFSLRSVVDKHGAVPPSKCIGIVLQLCDALNYAHARGVIHRDVKPDNVYILQRSLVKLTDFGIAYVNSEPTLTAQGQVFGTPSYMSPEQLAGHPVDRRTDVFSLGVLLYEILSGSKPFAGETIITITYSILNSQPVLPPGLSPGLQLVLQRAMAKDPTQRFQNMVQMALALKSAKSEIEASGMDAPLQVAPGQPSRSLNTGVVSANITNNNQVPAPLSQLGAEYSQLNGNTPPLQYAGTRTPPPSAIPPALQRPTVAKSKSPIVPAAIAIGLLLAVGLAGGAYYNHVPLPVLPGSTPGQMVYDDSLKNGWTDWSYNINADYNNSSPVHAGQYSIKVNMIRSYGALSFHLANLDTTHFKDISFWINGGPNGSPHLIVQGVQNNTTPTATVTLDALPANTWTHIDVPLTRVGMVPGKNITGFWIQDLTGRKGGVFFVDDVVLTTS